MSHSAPFLFELLHTVRDGDQSDVNVTIRFSEHVNYMDHSYTPGHMSVKNLLSLKDFITLYHIVNTLHR